MKFYICPEGCKAPLKKDHVDEQTGIFTPAGTMAGKNIGPLSGLLRHMAAKHGKAPEAVLEAYDLGLSPGAKSILLGLWAQERQGEIDLLR